MNILAIGSHPDDLECCCFGTLAKYSQRGDKVFVCTISNGNMGHVVHMPEELRAIRLKEAKNAAKLINAEHFCVDSGDFYVDSKDRGQTDKLVEVIREAKPDVIITHNPHDYMQDHIEAGAHAFNASFIATIPHYLQHIDNTTGVTPLYYMDTVAGVGFVPTEYVDITDTIELKLSALACHESQIKWMLEHDRIDFLDFIRTCSKYRGIQCGVPYAEGFRQCMNWPRLTARRCLP